MNLNIKETINNMSKKSLIFSSFLVLSTIGFMSINQSDYPVFDENKINQMAYVQINQKNLKPIFDEIEFSKEKNIVITYDSNSTDHSKNVKGIIDNNLAYEKDIKSIYIPKQLSIDLNKEYKNILEKNNVDISNIQLSQQRQILKANDLIKSQLTDLDVYNELKNITKGKNVYINQSFGKSIELNHSFDYDMNVLKNENIQSQINNIKINNNNLIQFLNENPNFKIISAAGNNFSKQLNDFSVKGNVLLKNRFDRLTNNDYSKTKELTSMLNFLIDSKINSKDNKSDLAFEKFKQDMKPLFESKKIDFNNFISLYIQDYLNSYEKLNLLESSKNLKNNNLNIVEAYNDSKFYDNYVDYKKFHNSIPELESYFTFSKIWNKNDSHSLEDKYDTKNLYEIFKDKYPEIFKYSSYGNFSFFPNHDSNVLTRSIEHHKGLNGSTLNGTSFATPDKTSDIIKEDLNHLALLENHEFSDR